MSKKLQVIYEIPKTDVSADHIIVTNIQDEDLRDTFENECCIKEVVHIGEAIEVFSEPMINYQWGASAFCYFESGLVLLDGKIIARISFNCRVWDLRGKNIHDWMTHDEFDLNEFDTLLA